MIFELAIAAPLLGLSALLALATRRDPARRARQEAVWRDLIHAAGLSDSRR